MIWWTSRKGRLECHAGLGIDKSDEEGGKKQWADGDVSPQAQVWIEVGLV